MSSPPTISTSNHVQSVGVSMPPPTTTDTRDNEYDSIEPTSGVVYPYGGGGGRQVRSGGGLGRGGASSNNEVTPIIPTTTSTTGTSYLDTPIRQETPSGNPQLPLRNKRPQTISVRHLKRSPHRKSVTKKDAQLDSDDAVSDARATIGNHSVVAGGVRRGGGGRGGARGRGDRSGRGGGRGGGADPHGEATSEAGRTVAMTARSSRRSAQSSAGKDANKITDKKPKGGDSEPVQNTGIPHRDDVCAPLKLKYIRPNFNRKNGGARFDLGEGSVIADRAHSSGDENDDPLFHQHHGGTGLLGGPLDAEAKAAREERKIQAMIKDETLFDGQREDEGVGRRIRMIVSSFTSAAGVVPKTAIQKRNEQLLKGMFAEGASTLAREYVRFNVAGNAGATSTTNEHGDGHDVIDQYGHSPDRSTTQQAGSSSSPTPAKRSNMSSFLLSDTQMYTKLKTLKKHPGNEAHHTNHSNSSSSTSRITSPPEQGSNTSGGRLPPPSRTHLVPLAQSNLSSPNNNFTTLTSRPPPAEGDEGRASPHATRRPSRATSESRSVMGEDGGREQKDVVRDGAGDPRWILFDIQELVEEEQRRIIRDYRHRAELLQDRDHLLKVMQQEKAFREDLDVRAKREAQEKEEQAFESVLERRRRESEFGPNYARPTSSNRAQSANGSRAGSGTQTTGQKGRIGSLPPLGSTSIVSMSSGVMASSLNNNSSVRNAPSPTVGRRSTHGSLPPLAQTPGNTGAPFSPIAQYITPARNKSIAFTADQAEQPPTTSLPHLLSPFFYLNIDLTQLKRRVTEPDGTTTTVECRRITPTEMIYIAHYLVTLQHSNGTLNDVRRLLQRNPVVDTEVARSAGGPCEYDCSCGDIDDYGGEDAVTILQSINSVGSINLSNITVDPSIPMYSRPRASNLPNHIRTGNHVVETILINTLLSLCPTLSHITLPDEMDIHAVGYLPISDETKAKFNQKLNKSVQRRRIQDANLAKKIGAGGEDSLEVRLGSDKRHFDEWEMSERCGIMQLEVADFRRIKKEEHGVRTGIVSSLQAAFTKKQHSEQRQVFVQCSLHEMIPQRIFVPESRQREAILLNYVQSQETIGRSTIMRSLRRMLEQLHREKREDLVVVRERIRNKDRIHRAACDTLAAAEERARRKLGGQALAPFFIFNFLFKRFMRAKTKRLEIEVEKRKKQEAEDAATMLELLKAEEQARIRDEEIRLFRLNHSQKNARAMIEAIESRARNVCVQDEYELEVELFTEFALALKQVGVASGKCVAESTKIEAHIRSAFPPLRLVSPLTALSQQRQQAKRTSFISSTPNAAIEAAAAAATTPNFYVGGTPLPLLAGWGIRAALDDEEKFRSSIESQLVRIRDILRPKYDSSTDMMNFRLEALRKAVSSFVDHELGDSVSDDSSSFGSMNQQQSTLQSNAAAEESAAAASGLAETEGSLSDDQTSLQQRFENFLKGHGDKELMSTTQVQAFLAADHNPDETKIVLESARVDYELALKRYKQKRASRASVVTPEKQLGSSSRNAQKDAMDGSTLGMSTLRPKTGPLSRRECSSYGLYNAIPSTPIPPIRYVPEGDDLCMQAFVIRGGSKLTIRAVETTGLTPGQSFRRLASMDGSTNLAEPLTMNAQSTITIAADSVMSSPSVFGILSGADEENITHQPLEDSPIKKSAAPSSSATAKYPAVVDDEDFIGFLSSTYDRDRKRTSIARVDSQFHMPQTIAPDTPMDISILATSQAPLNRPVMMRVNPMTISSAEAFTIDPEALLGCWSLQRTANSHVTVTLAQDAAFPLRLIPFLLGAFTFVAQKQSAGHGARSVHFDVSASLYVTIPKLRLWCINDIDFHDSLNGAVTHIQLATSANQHQPRRFSQHATTATTPTIAASPSSSKHFSTSRLTVQGTATGHVSLTFFNVSNAGTFYPISPSWIIAPSKALQDALANSSNTNTPGVGPQRRSSNNATSSSTLVSPKASPKARDIAINTSSQRGISVVEVDEYATVEAGRLFDSVHISAPSSYAGDSAVGASLIALAGHTSISQFKRPSLGGCTDLSSSAAAKQATTPPRRSSLQNNTTPSRRTSQVSVVSDVSTTASQPAYSPYEYIDFVIQPDRYEQADMLVLSTSHRADGSDQAAMGGSCAKSSFKKMVGAVTQQAPSSAAAGIPSMRRVVSIAVDNAEQVTQSRPIMAICHSRSKNIEETPSGIPKAIEVISRFDTPCYIYNIHDPEGAIVAAVTHGRVFTPAEATQHRALGLYADCHRVRISFTDPFASSGVADNAVTPPIGSHRSWRPISLVELESLVHQMCFVNRSPVPSLWPTTPSLCGVAAGIQIKEEETTYQGSAGVRRSSSFVNAIRRTSIGDFSNIDRPPSPLRRRKPISIKLCDVSGSTQVVHASASVRRVAGTTVLTAERLPQEAAFGGGSGCGNFTALIRAPIGLRRVGSELPKRRASLSSAAFAAELHTVKKTFAVCSTAEYLQATTVTTSMHTGFKAKIPPVSFLFNDASLLNPDTDHFSGGTIELCVHSQPPNHPTLKPLIPLVKGPSANLVSAVVPPSHDLSALGCVASRLRTVEQGGTTGKPVVATRQGFERALQTTDMYAVADHSVSEEDVNRSWLNLLKANHNNNSSPAAAGDAAGPAVDIDPATGLIRVEGVVVAKVTKGCVMSAKNSSVAPCARFWNGVRVSSLDDIADTYEKLAPAAKRRTSVGSTSNNDADHVDPEHERSVVLRIQLCRKDADGHSATYEATQAIIRSICFSSCTFPTPSAADASSNSATQQGEGISRSLSLVVAPGLSDGKVDVLKNVLLDYPKARDSLQRRIVQRSNEEKVFASNKSSVNTTPHNSTVAPPLGALPISDDGGGPSLPIIGSGVASPKGPHMFAVSVEAMSLDEATSALASITAPIPPSSLSLTLQLLPVLLAPASSNVPGQTVKAGAIKGDTPLPVLNYRPGQGNVRLPQLELSKDAPEEWPHGVVIAIQSNFALHPIFARVRAEMQSASAANNNTGDTNNTLPPTLEGTLRDLTSSGEVCAFDRLLPDTNDNNDVLRRLAGAASHGDLFTLISHDFDLIPVSQAAGPASGMLDGCVTAGASTKATLATIKRLLDTTAANSSQTIPLQDGDSSQPHQQHNVLNQLEIDCVDETAARYDSLLRHRFIKGCQTRGYDKRFHIPPPHDHFPVSNIDGLDPSTSANTSTTSGNHPSIDCYLVRRELVPEGTYEALGETPSAAMPSTQSKANPSQQRGTKHLSLQHPAVLGTFTFDFVTSRAVIHATKKLTSKDVQSLLKSLAYVNLGEDPSPMPFSTASSLKGGAGGSGPISASALQELCQSFVALESPIVKSLMLVVGDPAGGGNSRISIGVSMEGARKAPSLLSPSPQLTTRTYADITSTLQARLSQTIAKRCGKESLVWPSLVCHPLMPLNIAKLQYAEDQQSMPPVVITIRLRPLADASPPQHQSLCFMNPIQQEAARLRQFVLPGSKMTTIKVAYSCFSALLLVPVVSDSASMDGSYNAASTTKNNESQRAAEVMVGRPYIENGHPTAALGIPIQPPTLPPHSPLTERQHANPQRHPSSMMLHRAPSISTIARKASNLRRIGSMERSNNERDNNNPAGDPSLNNYTTIANFEIGSEDGGEQDSVSESGTLPTTASESPGISSVLPPPSAESRPSSSAPPSSSVQTPSRLYKLIHVTLKGYGDALQSSAENDAESDQNQCSHKTSSVVLENSLGFLSLATESALLDPKFTSIECPFVEDENVVGLVELFFGSLSSSSVTTPWSPLHLPVSGVRAHFNGGVHCDLLSYFMSLWVVSNQNGLPVQDAAVRINISLPQHRPTQRDLVIYNAPSIIQTPALVGGSSSAVGWRMLVSGRTAPVTATAPLLYPMYVTHPLKVLQAQSEMGRRRSLPSTTASDHPQPTAVFSLCDSKIKIHDEQVGELLSLAHKVAGLGPFAGISPTNRLRCAVVSVARKSCQMVYLCVDLKRLTTGGVIKFVSAADDSPLQGTTIEATLNHEAAEDSSDAPRTTCLFAILIDGNRTGFIAVSQTSVVVQVTSAILTPALLQEIVGCITVIPRPTSETSPILSSSEGSFAVSSPPLHELAPYAVSNEFPAEISAAVDLLNTSAKCSQGGGASLTLSVFEDHNPWPAVVTYFVPILKIASSTTVKNNSIGTSIGGVDTRVGDDDHTVPLITADHSNTAIESHQDHAHQTDAHALRGTAPPALQEEEEY